MGRSGNSFGFRIDLFIICVLMCTQATVSVLAGVVSATPPTTYNMLINCGVAANYYIATPPTFILTPSTRDHVCLRGATLHSGVDTCSVA